MASASPASTANANVDVPLPPLTSLPSSSSPTSTANANAPIPPSQSSFMLSNPELYYTLNSYSSGGTIPLLTTYNTKNLYIPYDVHHKLELQNALLKKELEGLQKKTVFEQQLTELRTELKELKRRVGRAEANAKKSTKK